MKNVNWRAALLGAAAAGMTVVILTAVGAGLMAKGVVDVACMGWFAAGILVASGLAAGLAARLGGGGEVDGVLAAVLVLVVLFGLNGVLCGGQMEGVAVTVLAVSGGCGAALLLGLNRGRRRRRVKRRR